MGAAQCRTDDNQHHNPQITTTNVSTNSRSTAQMNQSSNINDTDIDDNKSNEIDINQIDPSETVSSVASTIILSTDPSETSSTDPLDTATGDSSNASPAHPTTTSSEATDIIEFENWKAAFMHVINQNNLTQDIDDAFVQTVSTAHKLKGRGIISDKLYRVLYNQLNTQQWSLAITNAVARLRPGASGKSHQVAFAKQFGMEAVQIEDEMKSILHKKGKVVLCESMIDNVVRGLHNFIETDPFSGSHFIETEIFKSASTNKAVIINMESFESINNTVYSRRSGILDMFKLIVSAGDIDILSVTAIGIIDVLNETLLKLDETSVQYKEMLIGELESVLDGSFPRYQLNELELDRKEYNDLPHDKDAISATRTSSRTGSQNMINTDNVDQYFFVFAQ